jgi:hypothetical protein
VTLAGRYAGKYVWERAASKTERYGAQLVGARISVDVGERFEVGLQGSVLAGHRFHSLQYGVGPSVGFRVIDNAWLSVGYNVFGYEDRDLQGTDETDQGVYLQFRFKFDEELFGG